MTKSPNLRKVQHLKYPEVITSEHLGGKLLVSDLANHIR
ncbi:unnamed protein product, partial [Arabidopsis halleri]